jgi:histidinol dehydrogenase
MKKFLNPEKAIWPSLCARPEKDHTQLFNLVEEVFNRIKTEGDAALLEYTAKFDGVNLQNLSVTDAEFQEAEKNLDPALKAAIELAIRNIHKFHAAQHTPPQTIETMPGVTCWRKALPIEKVGLYIPGGTAPLFSTVLMLGIPAMLAGCNEKILCTPPSSDGKIHPAILVSAKLCGIEQVYKVGGIQAIAAMVYGTAQIPSVYKIFGPGNQYVTAAKQYAQLRGVAIDMPAGPSEVLVIADESANPDFIAADLLSQAEHGQDSQVMLVATNEAIADAVQNAIQKQLTELPRKEQAMGALSHSVAVIVNNLAEAMAFSNLYAPEHLILQVENARQYAEQVRVAGSVFIGHYTPESAGDYASGTNHTLPTNSFARAYSGVSLDSFMNKVTFQEISQSGLKAIGPAIETMATAESLDAHARAVSIRIN